MQKREPERWRWETQVTLAGLEDKGHELGDAGALNRLVDAENLILPRASRQEQGLADTLTLAP